MSLPWISACLDFLPDKFPLNCRLPIPVISVGNLTWGGTGKTPMVEYLARHFLAAQLCPLILTRVIYPLPCFVWNYFLFQFRTNMNRYALLFVSMKNFCHATLFFLFLLGTRELTFNSMGFFVRSWSAMIPIAGFFIQSMISFQWCILGGGFWIWMKSNLFWFIECQNFITSWHAKMIWTLKEPLR